MGSATKQAAARRARIEQMRREEKRRERRNKIIGICAAAVVLAGAAGGGFWAVTSANHRKQQQKQQAENAAKAPIPGVRTWSHLSRNHVTTPVHYPQTPPVGGNHNPVWMTCMGTVYDKPVPNEKAVHSMEHGAVWVTYNAKASKADLALLAKKVRATPYSFMSPYPTEKGTVTLTAWGTQLVLDSAKDPRVDEFFTKYVRGPQTQEPGAPCSTAGAPMQ